MRAPRRKKIELLTLSLLSLTGGQGPPGGRGPEGQKGKLLIGPGEKGEKGKSGKKGGIGQFREHGDKGEKGTRGIRGKNFTYIFFHIRNVKLKW